MFVREFGVLIMLLMSTASKL